MSTFDFLILPGDGIGTEIMVEVDRIISWFNVRGTVTFNTEQSLVGGAAYDAHGEAITDATMDIAQKADAVIFGAVGGPKWDDVPMKRAQKLAYCGCAKTLACLPICVLPFATQPWRKAQA